MDAEFKAPPRSDNRPPAAGRPTSPAEPGFRVPMGFAQRRLPWVLALALLAVFCFTIGSGSNPATLATLGRVAGWDWRPAFAAPLHYVVTWPVSLLPAGLQLFALNALAALLGAATIWMLARSVALLPHDRTKEQRQLERSEYSLLSLPAAWLPPVLAALVCGLQLTFWEHATAATGEMLDLLVFAWLIRNLLEFRLDHRERWLLQFAFLYGLGVTNNYALLGFFPAFLAAIIWIKWSTFFNWRFVLRMTACGVAGLLLYLLLPALASVGSGGDYAFWDLLRTYMGMQKSAATSAFGARFLIIFLGFTSLLPILFIGIRWPASFGDTSPTGQALTNLTTHFIHLFFFVVCLYVTLDIHFSPRGLTSGRFALLPFYYLGALVIGYFAGYILLVFGSKPDPNAKSWQRPSPLRKLINLVLVAAVWIVLAAMPAALAVRNLPKLQQARGPSLSRLTAATATSLPAGGATVLADADDIIRLYSLADELRRRQPGHQHILIESSSLQFAAYHRAMERRHGARWPKLAPQFGPNSIVDARTVNQTLATLQANGGLYYLHPSFGYFFERFHLKPAKALYEMLPFAADAISAPALAPAEAQAQHAWWQSIQASQIDPLIRKQAAAPAPPGRTKGIALDQNDLDAHVARLLSRAANHFGVELQRAENFKLAGEYFSLARRLNPLNASALINEDYNRNVQAGNRASIPPSDQVLELIRPFGGNSDALLNLNGPPDEPSACFFLAQNFSQAGNFRQAAQALERTLYFNPTNLTARLLYIAQVIQIPMPIRAMELVRDLQARPPVPLTPMDRLDLMRAEAWTLVGLTNLAAAEKLLEGAQQQQPAESLPYDTQVQIYQAIGQIDKAVAVLQRQVQAQPENFAALVNLAAFHIRSGRFAETLPYLERALKLKPRDPTAMLNRALAHLNLAQQAKDPSELARHVDAALADYRDIEATEPQNHYVIYGIAECYRLKKVREESIRYFTKYLKVVPASSPEHRLATQVLDRLKDGGW